jgi:cytochrome c1
MIRLIAIIILLFPFFSGCDYARMNEQEAIQTYREKMPEMPGKTIRVTGGPAMSKGEPQDQLKNPLPFNQATVQQGREGYGHYCMMCHGLKGDGNGTVGQSFYPLPTDLGSARVQGQSDGRFIHTLTFGLGRHPSLGFMLTQEDRWTIIYYIRSLKKG